MMTNTHVFSAKFDVFNILVLLYFAEKYPKMQVSAQLYCMFGIKNHLYSGNIYATVTTDDLFQQ